MSATFENAVTDRNLPEHEPALSPEMEAELEQRLAAFAAEESARLGLNREPVSYHHPPLPTILPVSISCDALSTKKHTMTY